MLAIDSKTYTLCSIFVESRHIYLMDEHAEHDVSSSGNEAYMCSEAVLSFKGGSTINLHNIRLIAYAHLNSTEFYKNQGMVYLQK